MTSHSSRPRFTTPHAENLRGPEGRASVSVRADEVSTRVSAQIENTGGVQRVSLKADGQERQLVMSPWPGGFCLQLLTAVSFPSSPRRAATTKTSAGRQRGAASLVHQGARPTPEASCANSAMTQQPRQRERDGRLLDNRHRAERPSGQRLGRARGRRRARPADHRQQARLSL